MALAQPQGPAPAQRPLTLPDVERLYLDGRITAKDFQQFLKQLQSQPPAARAAVAVTNQPAPSLRGTATEDSQARALEMLRKITGKTNEPLPQVRSAQAPAATTNVSSPSVPIPEPVSPELTDVEKKMNELLRLKEARERTNQVATNAPPSSTGPKSKRQRLDDLLKEFIEGKVTEADYKQRREKIIAEPE